jgi:hypothetical protein
MDKASVKHDDIYQKIVKRLQNRNLAEITHHMPAPHNSFVKAGLPLVTLTVCGWLGLSYFIKGRIDVQVTKHAKQAVG